MRSKKGQALVEFAIILPVILMLIFIVVDFGRIISTKNDLENIVSDAATFYENGKNEDEINKVININRKDSVKITVVTGDEFVNISAKLSIKPITPGLTLIQEKVFDVKASRVIYNE